MGSETLLFSIFTPEGRANPYPALAELRRTEPVYYHAGFNTYFLTRFADCQAVLTDPAFLVPDLDWCAREVPDWCDHPSAEFFHSSLRPVVDVGGVTVPEGAHVTTVLGAANRDPDSPRRGRRASRPTPKTLPDLDPGRPTAVEGFGVAGWSS
ncbi:hypothetical protein [Streptomyces sp. NPDC088196]|uniref:hypothetical protein n=1 Tax=Streptomyces sp. NPDC088196 TaxID=3154868 RepID=UPI00344DF00E